MLRLDEAVCSSRSGALFYNSVMNHWRRLSLFLYFSTLSGIASCCELNVCAVNVPPLHYNMLHFARWTSRRLCRGGVGSVQEAAVRREPGGHRENDPFRQGAPEHERTPPPRVWQELSQQEDAQGRNRSDPCCGIYVELFCVFVGKVPEALFVLRQHSFQYFRHLLFTLLLT